FEQHPNVVPRKSVTARVPPWDDRRELFDLPDTREAEKPLGASKPPVAGVVRDDPLSEWGSGPVHRCRDVDRDRLEAFAIEAADAPSFADCDRLAGMVHEHAGHQRPQSVARSECDESAAGRHRPGPLRWA